MILMGDCGYCLCFVFFFLSFFYPLVLVASFSPLEIAYIFVLSVLLLIPWRFFSKLLFFIKYKLVIAWLMHNMWRIVYIFSARLGSYMLSDIITSLCVFNVKVNWCSVFYTFDTYRGKGVEPLFEHMELVYYKSMFQLFFPCVKLTYYYLFVMYLKDFLYVARYHAHILFERLAPLNPVEHILICNSLFR